MVGVKWALQIYMNGIPPSHPAISPLKADLSGLCPILIQAGDSEVVTDDAKELYSLAAQAGNSVELQIYKDAFHVFHSFPFMPQSTQALKRAGRFVKAQIREDISDTGCGSHDSEETEVETNSWLIDLDDIAKPI